MDARTNSADEVGQRLEAPVPGGASSAEVRGIPVPSSIRLR